MGTSKRGPIVKGRMILAASFLLTASLQNDREIAVPVRDAQITVVFPERALPLTREQVLAWVETCGATVADYFDRFPVSKVRLELSSRGKGGIRSGRTWNGRLVRIELGSSTREQDLAEDWMLTHEFLHLAFPDLDEKHAWLYEGYATYVEPIARVRSGRLTAERLWKETLEGMPKGLPADKDGGLDGTQDWGRTYWGGALFWLRADLDIRERSQGKATLQTALRAILGAGGDGTKLWPVEELLTKGDLATGTTVFHDLYRQMGQAAYKADLKGLFRRLGVEDRRGGVILDDQAPLASLRRALTTR